MLSSAGTPLGTAARGAIGPAASRLVGTARVAAPALLFGLRLWASVCLALYVAFWLELGNASWAGTSAAIVCQPQLGASLRKGWFRMVGTVVGGVAIVTLTALFPQDRAPFLVGLALWGAGCALLGTLLRNFAAYAAALAGYTAAIVASDQLGATGGPDGDVFLLALYRVSETCIGIVCAGIVLAGTDFGAAQRRLATLIGTLSAEITAGFAGTLALTGANFAETQQVRRELTGRVIALDPMIDQAAGESSQLRYHSGILQRGVDGLFAALVGWRAVAVLLSRLTDERVRQGAGRVLALVPEVLRRFPDQGEATGWTADPGGLRRICDAGVQKLIALPADTPSLRLLTVQTAKVLAGISAALDQLVLLTTNFARPGLRRGFRRGEVRPLRIPDWLPALVNAGRAVLVIGAAELFWIVTEWPSGATAVTFAAIAVILLALRADQAYASALSFTVGTGLSAALAAIIGFAVLPNCSTFTGFAVAIGIVLVPVGAGMAQPWQTAMFTAMAANFVPLLAPANPMSYDTVQFYNSALAIVGGSCAAAISFRLLPPLSPAFRTRRLLALTVRDLRRLIMRSTRRASLNWEGHGYGRLSALPEAATPLQRAQLLAVVSVGIQIVHVRHIAEHLGHKPELEAALTGMAQGNVDLATTRLVRLDHVFEACATPTAMRARAGILAISELLAEHGDLFEARAGA